MEDKETPQLPKYGESKTTRIMMATVPLVTSGLGLRKFQADGFLFNWVYSRPASFLNLYIAVFQNYYFGNTSALRCSFLVCGRSSMLIGKRPHMHVWCSSYIWYCMIQNLDELSSQLIELLLSSHFNYACEGWWMCWWTAKDKRKGKEKCCLLEKVEVFDKLDRGMRSTVIELHWGINK